MCRNSGFASLHGFRQLLGLQSALRAALLKAFAICGFGGSFKRFRLQFSVLLEQNFDLPLCRLKLFTAGTGEANSFFKKLQSLLQWQIATFELFDNFFELLKAIFKFWQGTLQNHCMPICRRDLQVYFSTI